MAESEAGLIGIVLAAGAGERMGGPKALLVVDGVPLAIAHARRLRDAGCDDVTIVTRAEVAGKLAAEGARVVVSGAPDPAGSLGVGLRAIWAGMERVETSPSPLRETPSPVPFPASEEGGSHVADDPDARSSTSNRAAPLPRLRGRGWGDGVCGTGDGVFAGDERTILVVTPVDALPARVDTIAALVAAVRAGASAATPTYEGRGGHPVVARASALASIANAPRPLRDVLAELGEKRVRVAVEDAGVAVDLDTDADVRRVTGAGARFQ